MKIYIIYRGPFGEQIINNLALKGFSDKIDMMYELKPEMIESEHPSEIDIWTKIWQTPEEYIPNDLPIKKCDLLLVLGIHSKLGDLIPPIADKLGARAVLYPIGDQDMAPEAKKSIQNDLREKGVHIEFPEPFCALDKSENEIIDQFANSFGRPIFKTRLDKKRQVIKEIKVVRESPGGSASCVGAKLVNFHYDDREAFIKKIYEEHHNEEADNYCLAEMSPFHPLMQEAADLLKDAIFEACQLRTTKQAILEKISEFGEVETKKLEEIIVDGPGNWKNPEKMCDANRTFYLYIKELIEDKKIIEIDGKLKLA